MYTYNCVGIGIQISQHSEKLFNMDTKSFLKDLDHMCMEYQLEDLTPELVDECELGEQATRFLKWCIENIEVMKAAGIGVRTNYHGSDDYPVLIGKYVDDLFPIPCFGAGRMKLDNINQMLDVLADVRNAFSGLDPDILELLTSNKLIDIWINNHSS